MIISSLSKLLYSTKVIHKERLITNEPCIYIANHTSLLDAVLLSTHLPKEVVFVSNTKIAKQYAWVMKGKNVITVEPDNPFSVRDMLKTIKESKSLVIFPEGRITVTSNLMKVYSGVTYLALKTGVKLVPIGINGGEQAKKLTYLEDKIPTRWFPDTSLYVGEPFQIEKQEGKTIRQMKEVGTRLIYRKLQEVLFISRMKEGVHLAEVLRQRVKEAPKMIIAEEENDSVTLKGLWRRVLALSMVFEKNIIQDRIGVLLPTSIANTATFYGLLHCGKTPAMLNFSMDAPTLTSCLDTGGILVIITSRLFVKKGKLEHLTEACSQIAEILYLEDLAKEVTPTMKAKVLLQENKKVTSEANEILLFTSGSEGFPKGVLLTHQNLYANVQQAKLMIDFTSKDKILNALPMFHTFGLFLTVLGTLAHVPSFFIPSPLLYKVIPEIAYQKKATILVGTSTFLSAYGRYANPYDFFSLRYIICGAEKCQEHVRELWMKKFGLRILEGYGMTETAPVLALQTPILNKENTVGCLVPGVKYRLEEVEGIDKGGKLQIQAPNLMKGYLINEKGFVPTPEWFDTGDIVTVDEEGFITIEGRAKLFVKIAGEMISLPFVEEHAKDALSVEEVVAVGAADKKKGERIVLVTTSPDTNIQNLRDYWKEHKLTALSFPSQIHYIEKLPMLGSGKVNRKEIEKQIADLQ